MKADGIDDRSRLYRRLASPRLYKLSEDWEYTLFLRAGRLLSFLGQVRSDLATNFGCTAVAVSRVIQT
jgi:hypothetical protein